MTLCHERHLSRHKGYPMDNVEDSDVQLDQLNTVLPPKRKGRPPKRVEKRPVGRPKGEAAIMKQYRERMLNSPRSIKVLDSIFAAALNDDHKNQAAAWKIVVDRIVPVSSFEKEAGQVQRSAIQVNITGVAGVEVSTPEVPLEGECSEVDPDGT